MEPTTLEQKSEILSGSFPVGSKVCNIRLGSVGFVVSDPKPFNEKIFLRVRYEFGTFQEDVECLVPVTSIRKAKNG